MIRAGNEYKVGIASNLKKRLSSIQTSNAKKVELVCARRSFNASLLEKQMHDNLKKFSGNGGREWFTLTPQKAIEVAIKLNMSPEAETSDLIIENINLDMRKIMNDYWDKIERELSKPRTKEKQIDEPKDKKHEIDMQSFIEPYNDPLFEVAKRLVKEKGIASTSMLQRELRIGYGRAARIIDNLEQKGIVSSLEGIRREVLV